MKANFKHIVCNLPISERMQQMTSANVGMNVSYKESTDLEDRYSDWVLIRYLLQRGYEVEL